MTGDLVRVVLADDHAVVRAGLKAVLSAAPDIQVVGEAATGREAVEKVQALRPDVFITDLSMPDLDGTGATREIVTAGLSTRVLVLTMHTEEESFVAAMRAGAAGFLLKTSVERELIKAVRAIAWGGVYLRVSPRSLLAFHSPKAAPTAEEQFAKLTERERSVLQLVGQGFSAPEIATQLYISPKTVDTYKQRIQEKLNFSHRSHYVQFALRLGLLARS